MTTFRIGAGAAGAPVSGFGADLSDNRPRLGGAAGGAGGTGGGGAALTGAPPSGSKCQVALTLGTIVSNSACVVADGVYYPILVKTRRIVTCCNTLVKFFTVPALPCIHSQ